MPLNLGRKAPNFIAESTSGVIKFHSWLGNSWGMLLSHPNDFGPVSTTELGRLAQLIPQFEKRNVKIIAISTSSLESHRAWIREINESQRSKINFPLIADTKLKVASLYEMINTKESNHEAVRTVFIISPNKTIKLTLTYPTSTGRNFLELLRVIDSLQLTEKLKVATPADWYQGEKVIILPSVSDEEAVKLFPEGFEYLSSYIRVTSQPKNK